MVSGKITDVMSDKQPTGNNQRESFRVHAHHALQAELFHEGRVEQCGVLNLSAGGANISTTLLMKPGSQCTIRVKLEGMSPPGSLDYVSFLMEILEMFESKGSHNYTYRLKNTTEAGSPEYEAAMKFVFEAQRRLLAHEAGTSDSSPMVSDEARRNQLRVEHPPRFSKDSMRPGS